MEPSSAHLTPNDHIIDIPRNTPEEEEERPSTTPPPPPPIPLSHPPSSSSSVRSNPRNHRRRRNPLNSGLWISIELLLTLGQIIAAILVLSLSKHEHPRAPLFAWIVGYASGCVATLPLLYWRYYHHSNQASDQDDSASQQHRPNLNVAAGPFAFSISSSSEAQQTNNTSSRGTSSSRYPGFISSARYIHIYVLMN